MKKDNISALMERAKKLLVYQGLTEKDIHLVEDKLGVKFPDDFKNLSFFCSYEFFNIFDTYSFPSGVINETINWRISANLPSDYVVLSENGTSAVLMKLENEGSTVIYCSLEDAGNLCEGKRMEYKPTIFPSFADFFEYLLEEEEKIQAED